MKRNDVSQDQMINYVLGELSSRQAKKLRSSLWPTPELKAECDQLRELLGKPLRS
ncbi:MAG: hypothetical protein H6624_01360 [Bdellovibrionaceae bacterium]|nr:hypothetical protein [Pseudobdellovibrionaceae bacterium]